MKRGTEGQAGGEGEAPAGRAELVEGIASDARAEAAKIIAAAEQEAEGRRKAAASQAASILEEARRRAQETVHGIKRQGEQTAAVETRRMGLRVREEISQRVATGAGRKLAGMIGSPAYRDVLKGWIVEATLGLNAPEAEVLASGPEMAEVDDALLAAAAAEVKRLSGVTVRLSRSAGHPLVGQGVVITAGDGRTAFNNQVATRMERYQSEIRKLIYEALKES
jgi:vacuolar-type H+-ATPase subunit E/Vma4